MPGRLELSFPLPQAADWETSPSHRAKRNLSLRVPGWCAHSIWILRALFYPAVDQTVSSQNSFVKSLTPNAAVFGDRAFRRHLRLNEVISVGP